jgi:phosphatidylserine decarboxylase
LKNPILVYDRQKKETFEEKVLARGALEFLYGESLLSKIVNFLVTRFSFFSALSGYWLSRTASKKKILPFIREFGLDEEDFLVPIEHFTSFNDFFIRKLKAEIRPIHNTSVIAPADGRYLAFARYHGQNDIFVKGQTFSLYTLVGGNAKVTKQFMNGPFLIARLCPTDYHRYHFPVQGIPSSPKIIKGRYQSVNPIALKKKISIISENKRSALIITTESMGDVLFIAVGATNVASIQMTYTPQTSYEKGDELGFFSFGASMLLLFFEPGRIAFDPEILYKTSLGLETYIRFGESII